MLFNSLTFAVFLCIACALFRLAPGWAAKKRVLLVMSYVFYGAWSPPYIFLLFASTFLDWWLARLIDRSENPGRRKALLALSLVCNLLLLSYFKYADFLMANFAALLQALSIQYSAPVSRIVLPVGISFYTFASLSYTIDVYRREIRADTSLADYALFVSFFPHLVAGPIVRASYLLPQIAQPRLPTAREVDDGLFYLVLGLAAKAVLADTMLAPVVDQVYAAPAAHGMADTWVAVLAFSGQIFFDFSGYSMCAIGLARLFGFNFPRNFHCPYGAVGFSDFWRRWHISLSTWLRDYLYVPLGGNRGGLAFTCRNLLLTMLIGGLWHGASWMFVIWGALHGLYLVTQRLLEERGMRVPRQGDAWFYPALLATYLTVCLTWIPFRAASLSETLAIAQNLAGSPVAAFTLGRAGWTALGICAAMLAAHIAMRDNAFDALNARLGHLCRGVIEGGCLVAVYLCSGGDQRAFIYFQF
jgi:D-alanyl-lipoteichoic acid acyltransferase DltB (MBOAT superfamily)